MILLAGNWWTFVLRGIVAILFGLLCFILPGMALLTLVFMFGFYAIVDGVFAMIAAFHWANAPTHRHWWVLLLSGFCSIIAGGIALFMPGLTAIALLYLISAWAIVSGVFALIAAIRLRQQIRGEWVYVVSGLLSVIFGALVALFPGAGALALIIWIGAYAVVLGVLLITLGVKLRQWVRHASDATGHDIGTVAPGH
jgi:uncharacterized membrane protein HdeD (DUF308 family)